MFGYRLVREEYLNHLEIDNQSKAQMLRDYAEIIDGLRVHLNRYIQKEKEGLSGQIAKNKIQEQSIPPQV